jgi:hypothetical protein
MQGTIICPWQIFQASLIFASLVYKGYECVAGSNISGTNVLAYFRRSVGDEEKKF